ncbi:MAG: response regulator [Acidobacteria bacterium]|nr:response regulator [Acidobacteriota bacterium]
MSVDRPKILLADDSVTIRKVVELTFADEGIDVVTVPDGDAAMIAFVADEPDLVIADVNMPGVDGYKICEIIKEDDTTRHIPVILLTGSFEPFDPGEASRVGANFYFTKPFQSIRELVEKVTDLLDANAFETASVPETEDIDDLYKDSFAETLEIPANETAYEIELIRIEDDEEPDHLDAEPAAFNELLPERVTISDFGFEGVDNVDTPLDLERVADEESLESFMIESPAAADPFAVPVDLGDASLDDEMIETSRPDEARHDLHYSDTIEFEPVLAASVSEPAADPFASPVTTDDTMGKYNWADDAEGVVERSPVADTDSTLLKIEFADADHIDEPDNSESDPQEPGAAAEPAPRADAISPELIEMIAQRVIDKLSDKVVREVALEAVPRITQNMIR